MVLACCLATLPGAWGCDERPAVQQPEVQVSALPPLEQVNGIRDLALTPSRNFWILGTAAPRLVLQDASGVLVTAFGRVGPGPDEFGFPSAIVTATDTSVTVLDRERSQLRTFGSDGTEGASKPIEGLTTLVASDLDRVLAGSPFLTEAREGAILTSDFPEARRRGTAHLWNRRIVRVGSNDDGSVTLVDFREGRDRFSDRLAGASVLAPAPLWAACGDGSVATYVPFRDSVAWIGGAEAVVPTPATTRPLEEEETHAALRGRLERGPQSAGMSPDEVEAAVPMALEQLGAEMSSTAPAYVEMACDSDGLVWLQHFSVEHDWLGRGDAVDLVDRSGVVAEGLALPEGFRLLGFQGNTLLGVLRDEFDVERAGAITLDRSLLRR